MDKTAITNSCTPMSLDLSAHVRSQWIVLNRVNFKEEGEREKGEKEERKEGICRRLGLRSMTSTLDANRRSMPRPKHD